MGTVRVNAGCDLTGSGAPWRQSEPPEGLSEVSF